MFLNLIMKLWDHTWSQEVTKILFLSKNFIGRLPLRYEELVGIFSVKLKDGRKISFEVGTGYSVSKNSKTSRDALFVSGKLQKLNPINIEYNRLNISSANIKTHNYDSVKDRKVNLKFISRHIQTLTDLNKFTKSNQEVEHNSMIVDLQRFCKNSFEIFKSVWENCELEINRTLSRHNNIMAFGYFNGDIVMDGGEVINIDDVQGVLQWSFSQG